MLEVRRINQINRKNAVDTILIMAELHSKWTEVYLDGLSTQQAQTEVNKLSSTSDQLAVGLLTGVLYNDNKNS